MKHLIEAREARLRRAAKADGHRLVKHRGDVSPLYTLVSDQSSLVAQWDSLEDAEAWFAN